MSRVSRKRAPSPSDITISNTEDDILCRIPDPDGVLLELDVVQVKCTKVEAPIRLSQYQGKTKDGKVAKERWSIVFHFYVIEAPYEGIRLKMYVRWSPGWTRLPRSSKLLQCVRVALNGRRRNDVSIRKSWFVGHIFRVRLRRTTGPDSYTVVHSLLALQA